MSVKIELGGGAHRKPGFISLDVKKFDESTLVWDLEKGLPQSVGWLGQVEEIWADNVLEHINNLIPLMNSCYNALKPNGIMTIIVPLAGTVGAIKDPTHVRHFIPQSFDYFDRDWDYERQPDYGILKWHVESIEIKGSDLDYRYIHVILRKPQ